MHKDFTNYMRDFLLLCKEELKLNHLPKITWETNGFANSEQPTFGMFNNKNISIKVELRNRHILDIMRTLAHELVHYKQSLKGEITFNSGETGSAQENEANAVAGIIMRKFNKAHPKAFGSIPIGCKSLIGKAISYD